MIWDNNSNHVVALYGDDKLDKVENYWFEQGLAMKCDSFTVILKDETFDMDFVYRDFLLQSIDEDYEFNCRIISACYWPDSCAPVKSAFDLINKIRQLRAASNMSLGPIIVHDL
jgi:receptor-type tyrosine-protein phosphatase gamma